MKLQEATKLIRGRLEGDPAFEIRGLNTISEAGPYELVFLFDVCCLEELKESSALAVVLPSGIRCEGKYQIWVPDTRKAYRTLALSFSPSYPPAEGVEPTASIHPSVKLGARVAIGAFAFIGEGTEIGDGSVIYPHTYVGEYVRMGKQCILYPRAVIREHCCLGHGVIVHSGAVIGADGFGYEWNGDHYEKVPHIGHVTVSDEVEIGANTTIDRGTVGSTRIGKGTKIDNLVMVAHNVSIGCNVVIAAQSGIAGSSSIGDGVMMGGQCGVSDHTKVGKKVIMTARAGVANDLPPSIKASGFPAQEHRKEMRERALVRKLPEIWQSLRRIQQHISGK